MFAIIGCDVVNVLGRGGKKCLLNLALTVRNQTESCCPVHGGAVWRTGKMPLDNEKARLQEPGGNRTDEQPGRAAWKKKASDVRGPSGGLRRHLKSWDKMKLSFKMLFVPVALLFCWLKNAFFFFVLLNSSLEEALMEIIICWNQCSKRSYPWVFSSVFSCVLFQEAVISICESTCSLS